MTREYTNLSLIHCLISSNVKDGNTFLYVKSPDLTFLKDIYAYMESRRFKHAIPNNVVLLYNMYLSHPDGFLISSIADNQSVNLLLLFHVNRKQYKFRIEYKDESLSIHKNYSYRLFNREETKHISALIVKGLMNFFKDKV